jgi:hypothetical protein
MIKFKQWLINRFLPVWAKETLLKEYEKLLRENAALKSKLKEQDAYIDGLQIGIKNQRRIIINNGEVVK